MQQTLTPTLERGANNAVPTPVLPIDVSRGIQLDVAQAREIGYALAGEYCFAEPSYSSPRWFPRCSSWRQQGSRFTSTCWQACS